MKKLRALTLYEPWASLVVAGAKPFEFRGHRPPSTIIGERIVIHASRQPIDRQEVRAMLNTLERKINPDAAELCLVADKAIPVLRHFLNPHEVQPYGCGLGTAIGGEGRNGLEIANTEFGAGLVDVGELNANWGWPLTDVIKWAEPVPARGYQGIWFWPDPEEWMFS